MTEATLDETPSSDPDATVVPGVGLVLAAVLLVAIGVPIRDGTDALPVLLAAGFAALATAAFLGRRQGVLERSIGGLLAAGSGLAVVACSVYAINVGATGSVVVPGLEQSLSFVFGAFLVGVAVVGIGVAEYAGLTGRGLRRRAIRLVETFVVGAVGLLSMDIALDLLAVPTLVLFGEPSVLGFELLNYLSIAVGLGAVAGGYLLVTDRDRSFVDLRLPTLRDAGWMIAGVLALFGLLIGASLVMTAAGVETADHGTVLEAEQNPELLFVILPAMVLIVGPFEELVYRNVVQKSLYETFSRYGAVVAASLVFASVHLLAYATAGPGEILASLTMIFGLSLVLGTIYERTDNLLVPALAHGVFNAVQFLLIAGI
ncbi:CPBP family intramembrane glutamic endopeptidase [Halopiger goleimassiliensis]|uniref:CPBP family intramembrane glutamic endopeptidase n=1 Tax=Halopiger goleimassiliensis TaxID=1293048 RepID=UPI0006783352|nr:type II CAAX endopeptidase family protein [Halopiger goleimassiliensis]